MRTLTKISLSIVLAVFLTFLACNNLNLEPNTQTEVTRYLKFRNLLYRLTPLVDEEVLTEKSSVTFIDGKYTVDTTVIRKNRNKKMLLADLSRSYLTEKKNLAGIPGFITAFLDSISYGRKFEIVNPGEEWTICTRDCRHVFTKVYDQNKKDTVMTLIWYGKHYPIKKMVYFGIGKHLAILSYHAGGNQEINVIKFEGKKITDFWFSGINPLSVTNQAELIKQIKLIGTKNNEGC